MQGGCNTEKLFSKYTNDQTKPNRHKWKLGDLVELEGILRILSYTLENGMELYKKPTCKRVFPVSPPKGSKTQLINLLAEPSDSMERQKERIQPSEILLPNSVLTVEPGEKPSLLLSPQCPHRESLSNSLLWGTLGKQLLWLQSDRHRWHHQLQVI